ncbi:MAG: alkaline phosphatase family protein [Erysipelotrichaceae bacterium]|nr:alkaline phosphatase family protein [Erysipelotrichaceae bacterium]MDD3924163.1 alkaline phosphatase family protein [Erysipelotrichaceae bacterium]MDD4642400.1 alkaline phosphatase family protein [Erysipelotrichaceae bacterium]
MLKNLHCLIKNKGLVLPDYDHCSVNLINSLLGYYGCEQYHSSLSDLTDYLKHGYKHVFLIILDGMGTNVIEQNLTKESFIRSNHRFNISAVFPCTTVAATTSLQTGKTPIENGWLGWHQYIPTIDEDITLFTNTIYYHNELYKQCNVAKEYLRYVDILTLINAQGIKTNELYPAFKEDGYKDFSSICSRIKTISKTSERSFTYVYWDQPDAIMHYSGCYSQKSKEVLQDIDQMLSNLSVQLDKDSLLIITPDHGMIDVEEVDIKHNPSITECLKKAISFETRCNNFFIKEGMHEQFKIEFERYFDDFMLLSKQEVINLQLFGKGVPHRLAYDMIGDYVAIATKQRIIKHDNGNDIIFKAHHAGLTKEEMQIPLIVFSKAI